jgi:GT2 family glycosyltransferase
VDDERQFIPVFWAGGGSCAFDRKKYLQIGGLDPLYHPFYVEDTDLSYQAWKRGWKCLLAPSSKVTHKHRATSGKKYGHRFVDLTIRRNTFLFVWKNITDAGMTLEHVWNLPRIHGRSMMERDPAFEISAFMRAISRLPGALFRRLRNFRAYRYSDREVMARSHS